MLLVVRYELDLINCDLFVRINLSKADLNYSKACQNYFKASKYLLKVILNNELLILSYAKAILSTEILNISADKA